MAYDDRTVERVRRVLEGRRGVVEQPMMGLLAFMVNGSMCCAVGALARWVEGGIAAGAGRTGKAPRQRRAGGGA